MTDGKWANIASEIWKTTRKIFKKQRQQSEISKHLQTFNEQIAHIPRLWWLHNIINMNNSEDILPKLWKVSSYGASTIKTCWCNFQSTTNQMFGWWATNICAWIRFQEAVESWLRKTKERMIWTLWDTSRQNVGQQFHRMILLDMQTKLRSCRGNL